MVDLATASIITGIVAGAVTSIDKLYRGYADFFKKQEPTVNAPPPDYSIQHKPEDKAIITVSARGGQTVQKITYEELTARLAPGDRAYVETLGRSLHNYELQWNSAYEARSMASGMDIGRYDAQLTFLSKQIADPLKKVLDFVETQMGVGLDDHYLAARDIAKEYLLQS